MADLIDMTGTKRWCAYIVSHFSGQISPQIWFEPIPLDGGGKQPPHLRKYEIDPRHHALPFEDIPKLYPLDLGKPAEVKKEGPPKQDIPKQGGGGGE